MTDRHIKWILLASLLINAVLVGFLVGSGGRGGFRPMMAPLMRPFNNAMDRPGQPGRSGERMIERMQDRNGRADQPTREALREAFQAERPAMNKALKDLAAARAKSADLIRAETVDGPALDASLAQMRLHSDEVIAAFHRALAASAGKLAAAQRRVLARQLDRAPGQRGGNMPAGMPRGVLPDAGAPAPPPPN